MSVESASQRVRDAQRALARAEAMDRLVDALIEAQEAGVWFSWISDDPANPFISISISKEAGEQFMTWEPASPTASSTRRVIRKAT